MKVQSLPALPGKKIFFASDFHLGVNGATDSRTREKMLLKWFDECRGDAGAFVLLGDVFDFWFEYRTVVQKGYVRLLGKLAEITDQGVPVYLFRGNHDIWAFNYLSTELGITLFSDPVVTTFGSKTFFLAHGDGLGPGDFWFKVMKRIFKNRFNQWLFSWLHPDAGSWIARFFSDQSRYANQYREEKNGLPPIADEMLYQFAVEVTSSTTGIDYFIFGHRHRPECVSITENTTLVILGDWLYHFTYAEFDGHSLRLKRFSEL